MKKLTIREVLTLLGFIALLCAIFCHIDRNLIFAIQIIVNGMIYSDQSPRRSFWKFMLVAVCVWGLIALPFNQDLSEVTRIILAGLLLVTVLFTVFPIVAYFRRKKVCFEDGDIVLCYQNQIRRREPVSKIASYRFHLVWFVELKMKDHSIRLHELPSLSWRPTIQKIMMQAGIPVSSEGATGGPA